MPATYNPPAARPLRTRVRATYTARPRAAVPPATSTSDAELPLTGETRPDSDAAPRARATYNPPPDLPTSQTDTDALPASVPPVPRAVYNPPDASTPPGTPPSFVEDAGARLRADLTNPVEDENGRVRSGGMAALDAASHGARTGSLGYTVGAAIGGFVGGALHPKRDEEIKRAVQVQKDRQLLQVEREVEKENDDRDYRRATTRLANANADYTEKVKPQEFDAKKAKDEQAAVLANLRTYKGQKFDPSNPAHAAFLARAQRANVFIDPNEWNNSAGNFAHVTVVDPENPTQTRAQFFNRVTGETTDAGQSGYVQPVDAKTGMTASQEHTDADRDAARSNLEKQRGVANAQGWSRIAQGKQRLQDGLNRSAAGEDRQRYAKALELTRQHDSLIDQAVKQEQWKDSDGNVMPIAREKADMLRAQAGDIVRHLNTYYGDLAGEPGTGSFVGAPAPRRPGRTAAAPAAAAAPAGRFTEADVRARAARARKDPDAAVAAARAARLIP